ncbi:MAG: peptide-methionine (S)-S-oxide reductase MsrA, partial [Planctomycetaceae bacterium]
MIRVSKYAAVSAAMAVMAAAAIGCNTASETTPVPPLTEVAAAPDSPAAVVDSPAAVVDSPDADAVATSSPDNIAESGSPPAQISAAEPELQTATFGAGCFWCVEAVFELLEGVKAVESGYCNGSVPSPTYRQVCTGTTGHAEVIRLTYDSSVISFEELLEVFWSSHDPTTLNRQGADFGTQYRSGVYYHTGEQKQIAEALRKRLNDEQAFGDPVVTEIVAAAEFYPAEDYHQDYYQMNGTAPYCRSVI